MIQTFETMNFNQTALLKAAQTPLLLITAIAIFVSKS